MNKQAAALQKILFYKKNLNTLLSTEMAMCETKRSAGDDEMTW